MSEAPIIDPGLSSERASGLAVAGILAREKEALRLEVEALRKDKARLDWLESLIDDVSWRDKSWITNGKRLDLVNFKPGETWPVIGQTFKTIREAIDAAMLRSAGRTE